jgi:hypothetical protein
MVPSANVPAEEEFAERLRELVNDAHANGVDLEGGWPVLNEDPDLPDWDVVVVELAKPR